VKLPAEDNQLGQLWENPDRITIGTAARLVTWGYIPGDASGGEGGWTDGNDAVVGCQSSST
jgi:hypothetical protein